VTRLRASLQIDVQAARHRACSAIATPNASAPILLGAVGQLNAYQVFAARAVIVKAIVGGSTHFVFDITHADDGLAAPLVLAVCFFVGGVVEVASTMPAKTRIQNRASNTRPQELPRDGQQVIQRQQQRVPDEPLHSLARA
jgi:hypothetical protein